MCLENGGGSPQGTYCFRICVFAYENDLFYWRYSIFRQTYTGWWGIPTPLKNDGVKVSWDDFPFPIYEMEK